jgi:hypothetical protein
MIIREKNKIRKGEKGRERMRREDMDQGAREMI